MSNQLLPCPFCQNPAEEVSGCKGWFSCADEECPAWHIQAKAEDWNRRATQPAAGEPIHQWADQDLWMDGDEADMASARAEGFKTRTLWTAPPAAAHGDEAVRKLVLPKPEQVMDVVMRFQWEDRKNGTGTTNWAANLGMTVVEYVARLNADAAGGPAVSLTDAEHWTEREVAEFLAIALRHVTVKGSLDPQDIRDAFRVMREQAAMRAQGEGVRHER